jgi:hypothetical protein
MRTALIILGGFILWGVFIAAAWMLQRLGPTSASLATGGFIAVWFLIAAINMWVGVTRAGYTFREELPIFLLIFALPAAVAVLVRWKLIP